MSSFSLAKAKAAVAFSKEKPRSSTTEWVDILTSTSYDDEVYDGIPELIESINLQASGPAEAARAIRKKIKHGNTHQQYRALVILNALVENCGPKFHTNAFADGQLTDALKHLATDSTTDPKVRKKVMAVLASWSRLFKGDRGAAGIAGLYRQVKPAHSSRKPEIDLETLTERERDGEQRRRDKEEAKRKAREKRLKLEETKRKKAASQTTTTPSRRGFDFEQEKPQVLTAIANASSAANNLVNAIRLVNTENESLLTNNRVQECLAKAKQTRKIIVRYIQQVENEEIIGTLIETNERIIAALESYDKLVNPNATEQDVEVVQEGLEAQTTGSEVQRLQEKQRAAVQRAVRQRPRSEDGSPESPIHPDLQDLSFGELGPEQRNLQPPIRPNTRSPEAHDYSHGSLSDFSDYESSDEEMHRGPGESSGSHTRKAYINVSDNDEDEDKDARRHITEDDDPFADPFAD